MSKKAKAREEEAPQPLPFDSSVMVKLVSCDDHVFYCDRNCAKISKLVRFALAGGAASGVDKPAGFVLDTSDACELVCGADPEEGRHATVRFHFLAADKLEQAIQYMYYKYRYDGESSDHRPPLPAPSSVQEHMDMLSIAVVLQI